MRSPFLRWMVEYRTNLKSFNPVVTKISAAYLIVLTDVAANAELSPASAWTTGLNFPGLPRSVSNISIPDMADTGNPRQDPGIHPVVISF
jgi:hypothetical protein